MGSLYLYLLPCGDKKRKTVLFSSTTDRLVVTGAVARVGRAARVQAVHAASSPLDDTALLAVQGRLGLAHSHPRHLHGRLHAVRRRVPTQRRTKQRRPEIQRARRPVQVKTFDFELTFYVPVDEKWVISEKFFPTNLSG